LPRSIRARREEVAPTEASSELAQVRDRPASRKEWRGEAAKNDLKFYLKTAIANAVMDSTLPA